MRQFLSNLDFDQVMRLLEVFSLERFTEGPLDSTAASLTFERVIVTPDERDDDPYGMYDDDEAYGLRSQDISITYAGQPIGSFAVREHEQAGVVVAVTAHPEPLSTEHRVFLVAWFQAFQRRLAEAAVAATAPSPWRDAERVKPQ